MKLIWNQALERKGTCLLSNRNEENYAASEALKEKTLPMKTEILRKNVTSSKWAHVILRKCLKLPISMQFCYCYFLVQKRAKEALSILCENSTA